MGCALAMTPPTISSRGVKSHVQWENHLSAQESATVYPKSGTKYIRSIRGTRSTWRFVSFRASGGSSRVPLPTTALTPCMDLEKDRRGQARGHSPTRDQTLRPEIVIARSEAPRSAGR